MVRTKKKLVFDTYSNGSTFHIFHNPTVLDFRGVFPRRNGLVVVNWIVEEVVRISSQGKLLISYTNETKLIIGLGIFRFENSTYFAMRRPLVIPLPSTGLINQPTAQTSEPIL